MTEEDKKLLYRDLSARISYGVIINIKGQDGPKAFDFDEILYSVFIDGEYVSINDRGSGDVEGLCEIRPYLRPIYTMTEMERADFEEAAKKDRDVAANNYNLYMSSPIIERIAKNITLVSGYHKFDWLNSNHFDYRGLIPKGLALEAPKGMY